MSASTFSSHDLDRVAGVDEAGRGPLAGPVVAAAVVLKRPIAGLADSKKLSAVQREKLTLQIQDEAVAWSVAWADPAEIDAINILHATMLAMRRALFGIAVPLDHVLVDGNRLPNLQLGPTRVSGEAIVKGDTKVASISAASILAKTRRDRMLCELDRQFPVYGFAGHKGYPTAAHQRALEMHGPCLAHRRSYAPVQRSLAEGQRRLECVAAEVVS